MHLTAGVQYLTQFNAHNFFFFAVVHQLRLRLRRTRFFFVWLIGSIGRRRNWPHANEKRLPKMKRRKKQETIEAPQTVAIKRIHVFSARVNQKATSISMCFFFHFKFVSSRVAQLAVLVIVAPADHFCRCRKVMTNRRCGEK